MLTPKELKKVRKGIRKALLVAKQLHQKKGKYYKKWKINTLNALKKQPM